MSWVRCPSAAPIIKNPRQRGACPQKQRRIGRKGYQLTAGPTQTRRYCSAAYQPKTSQSEPVVGPVRRCTQHRKYRVGRDTSSPTGTSGPYLPCSKISAGPLGQSVLTTGQPQAKASAITLPNPSQAEERTKTEARAM